MPGPGRCLSCKQYPCVCIDTTDLELLRAAIAASGLSARRWAWEVAIRDERTVRRWLAGDAKIPDVVVEWLRSTAPAEEAS